jgi:hypothetical protein
MNAQKLAQAADEAQGKSDASDPIAHEALLDAANRNGGSNNE